MSFRSPLDVQGDPLEFLQIYNEFFQIPFRIALYSSRLTRSSFRYPVEFSEFPLKFIGIASIPYRTPEIIYKELLLIYLDILWISLRFVSDSFRFTNNPFRIPLGFYCLYMYREILQKSFRLTRNPSRCLLKLCGFLSDLQGIPLESLQICKDVLLLDLTQTSRLTRDLFRCPQIFKDW